MFGNVVDGKMQLNDIGQLVEQEWLNTINIRHDDVRLHNYIVMPNHFHAIIEIRRGESHSPQITFATIALIAIKFNPNN